MKRISLQWRITLMTALRKKLRAALGYDPIRNRIGEGYLMGGTEE